MVLLKVVFPQLSTLPLNPHKFLGPTRPFAEESRSLTTPCVKNHLYVFWTCCLSLGGYKLEQCTKPSPQFSLASAISVFYFVFIKKSLRITVNGIPHVVQEEQMYCIPRHPITYSSCNTASGQSCQINSYQLNIAFLIQQNKNLFDNVEATSGPLDNLPKRSFQNVYYFS